MYNFERKGQLKPKRQQKPETKKSIQLKKTVLVRRPTMLDSYMITRFFIYFFKNEEKKPELKLPKGFSGSATLNNKECLDILCL